MGIKLLFIVSKSLIYKLQSIPLSGILYNDLIKHKYFRDPEFPFIDNCLKSAVSIRVTIGLVVAGFFFTCQLN